MNAILENLPRGRQTLLFSATQTRRVADLARLSLRGPEFIAVHAEAAAPTPVKLQQARRARRRDISLRAAMRAAPDTGGCGLASPPSCSVPVS